MKTSILAILLILFLFLASARPATAQIWRWVDQDGVLTFSSSAPPANARDAVPFLTNAASDPWPAASDPTPAAAADRRPRSGPDHPDSTSRSGYRRPTASAPENVAETQGVEYRVAETRYDASEANCCLSYVQPYPGLLIYSPYLDYAYSRRFYHRPDWPPRRPPRWPPYRQHRGNYHQRDPFGYRSYDPDYYSNPYRYRSQAPRYYRPEGRSLDRGRYGKPHSRVYRGRGLRSGHGAGYRNLSPYRVHR
jgi:hypothetical protein